MLENVLEFGFGWIGSNMSLSQIVGTIVSVVLAKHSAIFLKKLWRKRKESNNKKEEFLKKSIETLNEISDSRNLELLTESQNRTAMELLENIYVFSCVVNQKNKEKIKDFSYFFGVKYAIEDFVSSNIESAYLNEVKEVANGIQEIFEKELEEFKNSFSEKQIIKFPKLYCDTSKALFYLKGLNVYSLSNTLVSTKDLLNETFDEKFSSEKNEFNDLLEKTKNELESKIKASETNSLSFLEDEIFSIKKRVGINSSNLEEKIKELSEQTEEKLKRISEEFDEHVEEKFEERIEKVYEDIDEKIDILAEDFGSEHDELEEKIDDAYKTLDKAIDNRFDSLRESIGSSSDDLIHRILDLEFDVKKLKERFDKVVNFEKVISENNSAIERLTELTENANSKESELLHSLSEQVQTNIDDIESISESLDLLEQSVKDASRSRKSVKEKASEIEKRVSKLEKTRKIGSW